MGVAGAAYATIISQFISCLISLLYIPKFKRVKLSKETFKLDLKECCNISLLGASNFMNQAAICLVQMQLTV